MNEWKQFQYLLHNINYKTCNSIFNIVTPTEAEQIFRLPNAKCILLSYVPTADQFRVTLLNAVIFKKLNFKTQAMNNIQIKWTTFLPLMIPVESEGDLSKSAQKTTRTWQTCSEFVTFCRPVSCYNLLTDIRKHETTMKKNIFLCHRSAANIIIHYYYHKIYYWEDYTVFRKLCNKQNTHNMCCILHIFAGTGLTSWRQLSQLMNVFKLRCVTPTPCPPPPQSTTRKYVTPESAQSSILRLIWFANIIYFFLWLIDLMAHSLMRNIISRTCFPNTSCYTHWEGTSSSKTPPQTSSNFYFLHTK
jgi:hypothetical protein